jgi:Fe-S cluster assembly iron-binding protein IscA
MLKVTEKAQEQIAEYFKDKETTPIRIFLDSGG